MLGLAAPGTYISGLLDGRKTVTTAGTRVQLSTTSVPCQGVIIQALRSNGGNIYVGGVAVSGIGGSETGISLVPGQTEYIPGKDLLLFYIDSDVNGEGITYTALQG